jgi:hypothetical protein
MDLELILSLVAGAIGLAAGIWKKIDADFWKKIAAESFELVEVVKAAQDENSPGGKELTIEEKAKIGEEALDVAIPLWDKFAKKFKKE